ncbi:MAG: sensor histidine kinase [Chloroflexota bacterium]
MAEDTQTSSQTGILASLKQWVKQYLDISPLVNLIQFIVGGGLLVLVLTYFVDPAPVEPWRYGVSIVLLVLIWVTARLVYRRAGENPGTGLTLIWIGITFILAEAITLVSNGQFPRILYALLPIIAIFHLPRRYALVITVVTAFWVAISSYALATSNDQPYVFQTLVLLLTAFLAGSGLAYSLLQERKARQEAQALLVELAESNEQLTRYAAEVGQLATMRERNRIAREIHDSLGHYLTVVGVQLEKAITFSGVNPEEADQAVLAAKHLTDQALTEVRNSVSALRETDESFTLHTALSTLVNTVQQSGLAVDWHLRGDEAGFSEQQLLTLFRAAQEGLTNVQKHADAGHVTVAVELDAETAILRLADDGIGFSPGAAGTGGYGLQGLRERIELVHGTMEMDQSSTGGAQLTVKIPKRVDVRSDVLAGAW